MSAASIPALSPSESLSPSKSLTLIRNVTQTRNPTPAILNLISVIPSTYSEEQASVLTKLPLLPP
jgi:hypothetical protein